MAQNRRSSKVTNGIRVEVASRYLERESSPEDDHYFFAYDVRISNEGVRPAKLVSRYWLIIDAEGDRQEVEGPGVVGENPVLQPGQSFEYTSFCSLGTHWGTMEGSYRMEGEGADAFEAEIGRFLLVGQVPEAAMS